MNAPGNKKSKCLVMEFDPTTIEHLGIHQYSTLPPVIAELVANAYDAESTEVKINLIDKGKKEIIIKDNGHGMSFDEINEQFLRIGRNRREEENTQKSKNGLRYVIGKKGIGKLSFFGISACVKIETIQNFHRNIFLLELDKLKKAGKEKKAYEPRIVKKNEKVNIEKGTLIHLTDLIRKDKFNNEDMAYSLSKYFSIFDERDFNVFILHNSKNLYKVTNKLRYKNIAVELRWKFPKKIEKVFYKYKDNITGEIISSNDTVPSQMRGVALFSRGKLVNEHSFYDINASSVGYSYITGWLNVDFIDDWKKEVIATNRKSLNWEDSDVIELKDYLNKIIKSFYNHQRKKRVEKKKEEIKKVIGVDIEAWIQALPKTEKKLANKMVGAIVNSEGLTIKKSGEMVKYVKDSFQLESFKEIASELDKSFYDQPSKLIDFFKEWKIIEAREMYKLSGVRIETIKKFEQHIKNDSREVPELHNFLKQFPWLLDPRIMNFKDEVTYSKLLKENFKDNGEKVEDRRIDFLCVDFSESFFIIELKRPSKVIGRKELGQANEYISFIKSHFGNEYSKNICCYIVGNKLSEEDSAISMASAFKSNRTIYVKPYSELLATARKYHQEFIDKYENFEKIKLN